ncbi:gamma-glutamyltransferase family protein [Actinophytocola sp.]|uniref:gamma-glutamyltransferase family protein n=1 Tax=Actinophytocola sp. TaxID=1872138 RepID=UPI003D6C15BC
MTFTTRPELAGTFGMVSSTHWIPATVGMSVLERGGNAFDAAVAAGFTLQVVQPHQNGPGGDLVAIFARADDPRPVVLCAQGCAPQAATVDTFTDLGLDMIPGSGPLAATIPGATPGWLTLLRDHGTISVSAALEHTVGYAEGGYPLAAQVCEFVGRVERLFRDHWHTSAALYLPGGTPPRPGSLFRNRALAATYRRITHAGRQTGGRTREQAIDAALLAWREGFVAEAVEKFQRTPWRDSSGADHPGLLTGADLAGWRPTYEAPARYSFRGYEVCKPSAWSQGPVLLQQLALLDDVDLVPGTAAYVHQVVECAKLAFADREAWYGDTANVPLETLLSKDYNDARRDLVGERAAEAPRPGSPDGRQPRLPAFDRQAVRDGSVGEPNALAAAVLEAGPRADGEARTDTVHVDVVDRWGNMVSAMPSGGWLHSSPVIPELGFGLGTRLQMAWLDPGVPNTLAPGKRPRTTLSPTLVLRDGRPVLAFGSPGGDQQDQWQLGFLLRRLVGGANLQEAVDAPAFHTTHFPSSFYPHEAHPGVVVVEDRIGGEVIHDLERRGHRVVRAGEWALGRLCAVARDGDLCHAAANPRGMQGYAVGR